jgi:IS5 family transposase
MNCVSWLITPIHSADTLNQPCPEERVDGLIESAKAHFRAKVEHPFRVIKQQFGFQKTRLRGMLKNSCKVKVLAALSNLFMARHELLCRL